jgi:hypothetical protein
MRMVDRALHVEAERAQRRERGQDTDVNRREFEAAPGRLAGVQTIPVARLVDGLCIEKAGDFGSRDSVPLRKADVERLGHLASSYNDDGMREPPPLAVKQYFLQPADARNACAAGISLLSSPLHSRPRILG